MKILLVDDEPLALAGLKRMVEAVPGATVIGSAQSARSALHLCETRRPDVVVLDIEMPEMDGVTLARELRRVAAPLIIFVTAYDAFAIDAFDVEATDYVLKPVDPKRLGEAIERARTRLLMAPVMQAIQSAAEYLTPSAAALSEAGADENAVYWASVGGRTIRVPVADILHVEACRDYAYIHTAMAKHMVRETMARLEEAFAGSALHRVHRSHIVNLDNITAISHDTGNRSVTLTTGAEIPVGRRFYARLRAALEQTVN